MYVVVSINTCKLILIVTIDHNGIQFTLRVCMELTLIYLAIEVWRHVNAYITKDDGTYT